MKIFFVISTAIVSLNIAAMAQAQDAVTASKDMLAQDAAAQKELEKAVTKFQETSRKDLESVAEKIKKSSTDRKVELENIAIKPAAAKISADDISRNIYNTYKLNLKTEQAAADTMLKLVTELNDDDFFCFLTAFTLLAQKLDSEADIAAEFTGKTPADVVDIMMATSPNFRTIVKDFIGNSTLMERQKVRSELITQLVAKKDDAIDKTEDVMEKLNKTLVFDTANTTAYIKSIIAIVSTCEDDEFLEFKTALGIFNKTLDEAKGEDARQALQAKYMNGKTLKLFVHAVKMSYGEKEFESEVDFQEDSISKSELHNSKIMYINTLSQMVE